MFSSKKSLPRLVTGVLIEISESWGTGKNYLTPSQQKPNRINKTNDLQKRSSATFVEKYLRGPFWSQLPPGRPILTRWVNSGLKRMRNSPGVIPVSRRNTTPSRASERKPHSVAI